MANDDGELWSFPLVEPRNGIGSLYLLHHIDGFERVDNRAPGGWGDLFSGAGRNNRRSARPQSSVELKRWLL